MGLCNSRDQESATGEGAFLAVHVNKGSVPRNSSDDVATATSASGHSLLFRPTKKIVILPEPTDESEDDGEAAYAFGSPAGTEATDVSDLSITPRSKKSPASSKKKQRAKKNASFTPLMPVSESCTDAVIPEEEDPEAPSDEEDFHEDLLQDKSAEVEEEPGPTLPQKLHRSRAKPPKIIAPEVVLSLSPETNDSIHPQHMSQFHRLKLQAKIAAKEKRRRNRMTKLEDRLEDVQGYRKLWNDYEKIKKNAKDTKHSPSSDETKNEEYHDPPGELVRSDSCGSFDLKATKSWFFDFQKEELQLEIRTVAGDAICDEEEENKSQANLSLLSASSLEAQRRLYADKRRQRKKKSRLSKSLSGQASASARSRCSDPGTPLTRNSSKRQLDYGPVRRRHSGSHLEDGSKMSVTNFEVTFSTPDRKGNGEDSSVVSDLGDDLSCGTGNNNDYGVYRRTRQGRRGADPNAQKLMFAFDRALFTDIKKPSARAVDPPSSVASQNRLDHTPRPRRGSPSVANALVMKFNDAASPPETQNASNKHYSETLRKIREMEAFLSKPQARQQHERSAPTSQDPEAGKMSSVGASEIALNSATCASIPYVAASSEQENSRKSLEDSYDLLSSPEDARFEQHYASDGFDVQVQSEADFSATNESRFDEPMSLCVSSRVPAKQTPTLDNCVASPYDSGISETEIQRDRTIERLSKSGSFLPDQSMSQSEVPPPSDLSETESIHQIASFNEAVSEFSVNVDECMQRLARVECASELPKGKAVECLALRDTCNDSQTKQVENAPGCGFSPSVRSNEAGSYPPRVAVVGSARSNMDEVSHVGRDCDSEATRRNCKLEEPLCSHPIETSANGEMPRDLNSEYRVNDLSKTRDIHFLDENIDMVRSKTHPHILGKMNITPGQSIVPEGELNRPTSEEVIAAVSINPVIAAMSTEEFFSIAERSAVERATALASFTDMFKVIDKYDYVEREDEGVDVSTPTQNEPTSQVTPSLLGESNRVNHLAALRGAGKESEAEIQGLILAEKVTKQVRDVLLKYRSPDQYAPDDEIGYMEDDVPDDER